MIQVLGFKRILIVIVLVAANAALAAATYMYVVPQQQSVSRQLSMTRSQIGEKRAETDRLRNEFDEIQKQKTFYENLQAAGFMTAQNRLVARRRIADIQKYSRVLRANYDISPAAVEQMSATDEVGYVVLNSPIKVDIDALDDLDFYAFIYWMQNAFPGHVAVRKLRMTRELDLNDSTLRAIGAGQFPTLVRGNVEFAWRTIVPQSEVKATDTFQSEGF